MVCDFSPDGEGLPDSSSRAPDLSSDDTDPFFVSGTDVQTSMAYEANEETQLLPSLPQREALGHVAMLEARDDLTSDERKEADEGRREALLRLAADVQHVRDTYRGVQAQAGDDTAPTTETIADLTDAIQEIATTHNETTDYGILEGRRY